VAGGGAIGGPLWQPASVKTAATRNKEWTFIARSPVPRNKRTMQSFDPGGKAVVIDGAAGIA
jgi:hypothetical protein